MASKKNSQRKVKKNKDGSWTVTIPLTSDRNVIRNFMVDNQNSINFYHDDDFIPAGNSMVVEDEVVDITGSAQRLGTISTGGFIYSGGNAKADGAVRLYMKQPSEEIWHYIGEPVNISVNSFMKIDPDQPKERYWSGGTNEDKGGSGVDVFVDTDTIHLGISNGENNVLLPITREDAVKLYKLLNEAVTKSDQWKAFLDFQKKNENNAEDTEPPALTDDVF